MLDASAYVRASQGNLVAIDYLRAHAYGAIRFYAPPRLYVEVANALRNGVLARRGTPDETRTPLRALLRLELEIDADPEISVEALDFALKHGITAYDAAYAVVSLRRQATLVTADSGLAQDARAAGVVVTLITDEVSR